MEYEASAVAGPAAAISEQRPMTIMPFDDRAPTDPVVTSYDERHRATYWRLLDAARVNADWREVVIIIFGIDAAIEAERARSVYDTHLARARWMSETGYRFYLDRSA